MNSYYNVQPSVDTWIDKLDPFNVHFEAHDGSHVRISSKQFFIIYDVTYDGSIPNLDDKERTYSDKDGNINLFFYEKCRVSIDLYMVKDFDANLDLDDVPDISLYEKVTICVNKFIPFEPYITEFKVDYISELPVTVLDPVPRKYIQIYIQRSDFSTSRFTIEKEIYDDIITINPSVIQHIDDNTIKVSYYDSLLEKTWEDEITVVGKIKELSLSAYYIPKYIIYDNGTEDESDDYMEEEVKKLYDIIQKDEIIVYIKLYDGYSLYDEVVNIDEWEFTTFPRITNVNMGIFKIARNDLRTEVRIPFKWMSMRSRLDAWYEGHPVKIGKEYVSEDFRINLYDESGLFTLIDLTECTIEPSNPVIEKVGWNWYTISYNINDYLISDRVAIYGYDEIKYPEYEFELLYLNPVTHSFEDVTPRFDEACTIMGQRWFNWGKILDRIKEMGLYGKYKLHAPILTGLSTRCDTDWIIVCKYKKAIRAVLIKTYIEEEDQKDG